MDPAKVSTSGRWQRIDHVQLVIPVGAEDAARVFDAGRLGFVDVSEPPVLAARGGAWCRSGASAVHVGGAA